MKQLSIDLVFSSIHVLRCGEDGASVSIKADMLAIQGSLWLSREAKRGEWRAKQQMAKQEEVHHRVAAAQAAEDAKMAAFRAMAAKGPITIAKRT